MKLGAYASFMSALGVSAALALSACGGQAVSDNTGSGQQSLVVDTGEPSRSHMLPVQDASAPAAPRSTEATPHLNYYGGPVLKNVQIYPIYWRSTVGCASTIAGMYTCAPTTSLYTGNLAQYSSIGTGTNHSAYVDTGAPSGTSVSESTIRTELIRLMNIGAIPVPSTTSNNYYPVHFPSGYQITDSGGARSCVVFCAYHSTFKITSGGTTRNVYFGVIPDIGSGGCQNGCGTSSVCNNTTSVASHELVEATTDPAVGLATTYASPLAWYDPNNGENADICNAQQSTVTCSNGTFTVQKTWSNSKNACTVN